MVRAMRRWWVLCLLSLVACETRLDLADAPACPSCNGCCDFGRCVPLTQQDSNFCGTTGPCQRCSGRCLDGFCKPASTCGTCAGCCSNSFCVAGNSDVSCGTRGDACDVCAITERCIDGACVPCSAANCNGCCQGATCLQGTADTTCGRGGAACRLCSAGTSCASGVCR